jgi:hypothetical protein
MACKIQGFLCQMNLNFDVGRTHMFALLFRVDMVKVVDMFQIK